MGNIGDAAFSQGDIMRRMRELERKVRELTAGRRLESASIGAGGLIVRGGNIDVQEGSMRLLDSGGNFLANVTPVAFERQHQEVENITVDATPTAKASVTLTPPAWATQAIIMGGFSGTVLNNRAINDYLEVHTEFDGTVGYIMSFRTETLTWGTGSLVDSAVVNLTGNPITVRTLLAGNGGSWAPAHAANVAVCTAMAVYIRG